MLRRYTVTFLIGISQLLYSQSEAADAFKPDAQGYIRNWLILAPIVFHEGRQGSDLISDEQLKSEFALQPKSGDKATFAGKDYFWRAITAATNYFDFNAALNGANDRALGYAVTYVECEEEIPSIILAVASNDQGRIYLNGVDIYLFSEPRTLELDADKGRIKLKKGLNTIVFKIFNEQGNWQGAMRFLDKSGAPATNLTIKLSP